MIPKIIHYVWLGKKEIPEEQQEFIKNWQKIMPDYKIMRWDEDNFDMNINNYCKQAYQKGKYAFASDYIRLWALSNYGGIYLDTDVEVLKPFDEFLNDQFVASFENKWRLATCVLASEKNGKIISEFLKSYDDKAFHVKNDVYNLQTINSSLTDFLVKRYRLHNLRNQEYRFSDCHLLEMNAFSPAYVKGNTNHNENTFTIHHFKGSWVDDKTKARTRFIRFIRRTIKDFLYVILGNSLASKLIEKNYKVI